MNCRTSIGTRRPDRDFFRLDALFPSVRVHIFGDDSPATEAKEEAARQMPLNLCTK